MKRILKWAAAVFTGIFLTLVSFVGFGSFWGLSKWGLLDINEIIFQLQAPLEGTESGILNDYFLKGLLPVVLLLGIYIGVQAFLAGKKKERARGRFTAACLALALLGCVGIYFFVWRRLGIGEWLAAQNSDTDFIADNYVDPQKVDLVFPEKKRNLIFVYMESIEVTYADQASGGAFEKNVIPELTALAKENEDFSGTEDESLNGGVTYTGTTFTSGAIFGQSTGLPLKLNIGGNNMDTQGSFFPGVTAIGDILQDQGYRQVFLCGSDATFGGRRLFFQDHGDFEIRDYPYMIEQGKLPEDYHEFWGYEDKKLFEYAKETLTELAQGDEPFNLTMLTVDTHMPDGYACDLCGSEFGDNQYANAVACSSRQVAAFVSWIKDQDFYENTTVILQGDHLTMSEGFDGQFVEGYRRKALTTYINSAVEPVSSERRLFSTMDNFPTTLASLGVRIDGDRLGLGTNLFSDTQTLPEKYGDQTVTAAMNANSAFLSELEKTDPLSETLVARYKAVARNHLTIESYDPDSGEIDLRMKLEYHGGPSVKEYVAVCRETGSDTEERVVMEADPDLANNFIGTVHVTDWKDFDGDIRVELHLNSGPVLEDLVEMHLSPLNLLHDDLPAYLTCLKEDERFRDCSILLAVKDEGTEKLNDKDVAAMRALGLEKGGEIAGQARISYVAKVEQGTAEEEAGYAQLRLAGTLQDGTTSYEVVSGGHDYGNHVNIIIDGAEKSIDHTGINIVVYDCAKKQLVDTIRFKTSAR